METIRRGNAKTFTVELSADGINVDLCLLTGDGKEICTIEPIKIEQDGNKYLYKIKIEKPLSELLGDEDEDKKYKFEVRVENEPIEEGEILITKKKLDEDRNEDTQDSE